MCEKTIESHLGMCNSFNGVLVCMNKQGCFTGKEYAKKIYLCLRFCRYLAIKLDLMMAPDEKPDCQVKL